ncbi:MAG: Rrf2 family transcriptional regulator [Halothiobacillus sp.]|jgi:Rrf2 family nitric oxide-sensitive transcriptional repressor|nr:Rrf2 family transcriptional regulator [Halothiobacillus sp.]HUX81456.1 Rrf2 family transcriptional regulator [Halothiobacillus sp.]
MQLNQQTDYALRVLILLARETQRAAKDPDLAPRLVTIREIADFYRISHNHLMKVVTRLTEQGFVHAQRGRGGGLRLGPDGLAINVGQVVRVMEGSWQMAACFSPENTCPIQGNCQLEWTLHEALQAFLSVLDRQTLADMVGTIKKPQPQLIQEIRLMNRRG